MFIIINQISVIAEYMTDRLIEPTRASSVRSVTISLNHFFPFWVCWLVPFVPFSRLYGKVATLTVIVGTRHFSICCLVQNDMINLSALVRSVGWLVGWGQTKHLNGDDDDGDSEARAQTTGALSWCWHCLLLSCASRELLIHLSIFQIISGEC